MEASAMKNRLIAAILSLAVMPGCGVITLSLRPKEPCRVPVDMEVINEMVCRGDVSAAQNLLAARGYDFAASVETVERARIGCPAH
jgi:hypothetical protein